MCDDDKILEMVRFWSVFLGLVALQFRDGCGGHELEDPNKIQFEAAFQGNEEKDWSIKGW